MITWEITNARFGEERLLELLEKGWEPFAVTADMIKGLVIWLRKEKTIHSI